MTDFHTITSRFSFHPSAPSGALRRQRFLPAVTPHNNRNRVPQTEPGQSIPDNQIAGAVIRDRDILDFQNNVSTNDHWIALDHRCHGPRLETKLCGRRIRRNPLDQQPGVLREVEDPGQQLS